MCDGSCMIIGLGGGTFTTHLVKILTFTCKMCIYDYIYIYNIHYTRIYWSKIGTVLVHHPKGAASQPQGYHICVLVMANGHLHILQPSHTAKQRQDGNSDFCLDLEGFRCLQEGQI